MYLYIYTHIVWVLNWSAGCVSASSRWDECLLRKDSVYLTQQKSWAISWAQKTDSKWCWCCVVSALGSIPHRIHCTCVDIVTSIGREYGYVVRTTRAAVRRCCEEREQMFRFRRYVGWKRGGYPWTKQSTIRRLPAGQGLLYLGIGGCYWSPGDLWNKQNIFKIVSAVWRSAYGLDSTRRYRIHIDIETLKFRCWRCCSERTRARSLVLSLGVEGRLADSYEQLCICEYL